MKIYVCHSSGFNYENEFYAPLKTIEGHSFVLPHEGGTDSHSKDVIASCDLVLAEVSFPSTGMGIELGWADAAKIPILCIHRTGITPSDSLRQISKRIVTYRGPDQIIPVIEAAFLC